MRPPNRSAPPSSPTECKAGATYGKSADLAEVEKLITQFLRTLRRLRDLRWYSMPVMINNPQQVNIAADGGQQVNVAKDGPSDK